MPVPRITVVGSYATGLTMKVSRIPCAGETLLGAGYRVDFGGKGSNQAVGCARLGAAVSFVACIGTDSFGKMAQGLYREEGVDLTFLKQSADAPTGVGFIVVEQASGQNSIVIDPGANELLSAADVAAAASALRSSSVVMTQLEIPVATAEAALAQGRAAGAVTILNPAPVRPLPASMFGLIDILTPNLSEARVLAGHSPEAPIDPEAVARELIALGARQVAITLGDAGALLVSATSFLRFPAVTVRAVDATGAGDAFNAGLATALAHGEKIEEAIRFATAIGGMAVTKEGVVPSLPTRDEALRFYREQALTLPTWLTEVGPAQVRS